MSEQSDAGLPEGNPEGTTGQELAPEQTTTAGTVTESTFFDPSSLTDKPELQAAYKEMQGAFTKRMQQLSQDREKFSQHEQDLALVEQFKRDPAATIRQLAPQYGINIGESQGSFEPKSWDDVIGAAEQQAVEKVLQQLQPFIKEVQNVKKQGIEAQLDSKYSDWRQYEDDMKGLLKNHPTLVNDVDRLYNMAVPAEILERRAYQAALKKIQGQTESAQMTGQTTTARKPQAQTKATSFQDAVNKAKEQLRAQGIK